MKRKPKNETPKMPRAPKTRTVYMRIDAIVVDQIKKIAIDRGRPHTFSSVAGELLAKSLEEPEQPKASKS